MLEHDYTSVPAGVYLCQINDVRERETRSGDTLWGIRLVVADGEFAGRTAAWDNLVFSKRGRARLNMVFTALRLDPLHATNSTDLLGGTVLVEVRPAEYLSPGDITVRRNEVPYAGYRSSERGSDESSELPGS